MQPPTSPRQRTGTPSWGWAALLTFGTLAWLLLSAAHGDLPGTGQEAVQHVAGQRWRPVHILTIVALLGCAGGFALLVRTIAAPMAAAVGRAGSVFLTVAVAVLGVDFAIDGLVLSSLAERWSATTDLVAKAAYVDQANFVLTIMGGTSFSFQTLVGIATATLALATLLAREYPRWLCWLGLAGGTVWAVGGLLIFSQVSGVGFWLVLIPVLPVNVWMIGIGWICWRRGARAVASGGSTLPDSPA